MLSYSSSYRHHLITNIRSNIPNGNININIPHIDFCYHVQISTDNIGSYVVVIPSGKNWADIAFLAPTLHANNLLEIGFDYEENCFLILPNIETYDKFVRILNFLTIDHTLDIHLKPLSTSNSKDNIDEPIQNDNTGE